MSPVFHMRNLSQTGGWVNGYLKRSAVGMLFKINHQFYDYIVFSVIS